MTSRIENSAMRIKGNTLNRHTSNVNSDEYRLPFFFPSILFGKRIESKIRDPRVIFHVRVRRKSIRSIGRRDRSPPAETDDGSNRRAIFEHTRVFGLADANREKANGSSAWKTSLPVVFRGPPRRPGEYKIDADVDVRSGGCVCTTQHERIVHARAWVCGRAFVCATRTTPATGKVLCLYAYISG